ncbi:MAG: hypothetical protein SGBAC_005803 [Bacillariaceae sp.]
MGKMKNLQLLENCFANSENIRDVAKMEAISSKLIRQNSRLQKEKEQLARQARKQELCIGHLLKKLENAADLAQEQQSNFDEALHQQTETVSSILQDLSKSHNEIIQLRNTLELERIKNNNTTKEEMIQIHRIPSDGEDFSDEVTVRRNNVVAQQKKEATAFLPNSRSEKGVRYNESIEKASNKKVGPNRRVRRHTRSVEAEVRMHRDRFRPDDDIEMLHQPFVQHHDSRETRLPRSGLQEADSEAPRPPLSRQSSGVRGSTQPPFLSRLPVTKSNSRSFAMDAVRFSGSSRSLGAAF